MIRRAKQEQLSSRIRRDLADRSNLGIWTHPFCMVLVFMTTRLHTRAPGLMVVAITGALLLSVVRWQLVRTFWRATPEQEPMLHQLNSIALMATAALWGSLTGAAMARFGFEDPDVLMLVLYHAVMTFGLINVLVHDQRAMVMSLGLLMLPLVVADFAGNTQHTIGCVLAAGAFFSYCGMIGFRQSRMYAQQISDNYDLSEAAYHDCLTGLPNRLFLDEALEGAIAIARDRRTPLALLYIDLDGFKQINDRYSHKIGDKFLCEASARIRAAVRKGDTAARVGGDEFTVLLPTCGSTLEAIEVAHRVLVAAREPVIVEGHALRYSASIGVSMFPDRASTAEQLMRSADEAMYAAKMSGKDRICYSTPAGALQLSLDENPAMRMRAIASAEVCLPAMTYRDAIAVN